jgi:hypothetical protein
MQKNLTFLLIVIILLCIFAESSIASEWVKIGSVANDHYFVDTQSIQRTGQKVKVWQRWVLDSPQKSKGYNPKKTYQSTKELAVYLCNERALAILQVIEYAGQ